MRVLARWCFRHRWLVVAAWVAAVVAANGVASAVGSNYDDNVTLPHTQSFQASNLLQADAPRASGDTDQLVIAVKHGTIDAPAVRNRSEALFARVDRLAHVSEIGSPYAAGAASQVAPSKRIAFADVTWSIPASKISGAEAKAYDALITHASGAGVDYEVEGQAAEDGNPQSSSTGLPVGFFAAAVVLFLVFGSFLATLLPLLTAGVSLGTGIAVVGVLSNVINMASFASELSLLIGLGVGIDYALFIVTRYRQSRLRGLSPEDAVVQALDTSGRAVLFAGMIVCIAMLGMLALGVSFLYGVAIAAAITVAFTVFAAVTLLPALLAVFGNRALRRRERRAIAEHRFGTVEEAPGWTRWAAILQRRPAVFGAVATAVMLLIAVPFLSMRLGSADASSDSAGTTTYKAYQLLAEGFGPGYSGPLQLVASVSTERQRVRFAKVVATAARNSDVASVTAVSFLPGRDGRDGVVLASLTPRGSPQAASTTTLLNALRDQIIPNAEGNSLHVLVGGQTAVFADFATVLTQKLPLFIGIVVMLAFVLLTAVFRSLVIPLTAAAMNLLSTAASLGVVTAVFQFGWLGGLFGISTTGPIESFLPVLLFPILFGLSMDYEVFLVSRIYEEWHQRGDNREAVAHGLAATGRTITAAAAIMVLVFGAFVLGGQRVIELFGIGLASAVLLDALIVRAVIVPCVMLLLGDANWALPHSLSRRIPHLRVEGERIEPALKGRLATSSGGSS